MIPNIFHFVYFYPELSKDNEFSLINYICIKSAHELNKPGHIYFYTNREPKSNEWWEKAKNLISVRFIEPPDRVYGRELIHPAHKSDITRINILKESGGIYLDMDVICKKSFTPLLNHKFVMGRQGFIRDIGLCNSVILAEKNAEFLSLWFNEFRNFRSKGMDKYWDEISVKKSYQIAKKYPNLIKIMPYNYFHYPMYFPNHLKRLFEKKIDYEKAYCHHLWETASKEKYLTKLTPEIIKTVDTTFNVIARRFF